jgi:hypothetical protein
MKESEIVEMANRKIIEFAKNQESEVWHQMVMGWNWDNNTDFLDWLIDNPKTDKATILMIYWKSVPNERSKNKKVIEERYNNFYNNQKIAYNPKDDEGTDWISEIINYDNSINTIPEIMFQKLEGKNINYPKDFIEGLPEDLFYEIENLYD